MLKKFLTFGFIEGVAKLINFVMLTTIPLIVPQKTYGVLSLVIAVEILLSGVLLLGFDRAIIRFLGEKEKKSFFSIIVFWFKKIRLVFLLLVLTLCIFFKAISILEAVLLSVLVFLISLRQLKIAEIRVYHKTKEFQSVRLFLQLLRLLLVIGFLFLYNSITVYLLASILSFLPVLYIFKKDYKTSIVSINKVFKRKILNYSLPLVVHTIAGSLLMFVDRFMIDGMISKEDLAIYTLGYTYGASISFVFAIGNIFFEPILVSIEKEKGLDREIKLKQYSSLLFFLGSLFSILFILIFPFVLDNFYSKAYKDSFVVSIIILLGHLFNPIYYQSNYRLMNLKKTNVIAFVTILVSIINIILNIYFIKVLGIIGASISTFVSYLLMSLILYFVSIRISSVSIGFKKQLLVFFNVLLIILALVFYQDLFILISTILLILIYNMKHSVKLFK